MPTESLTWIVGAGGHAKVVMDALAAGPQGAGECCFADDDERLFGTRLLGCRVEGPVRQVVRASDRFHVAIGSNPVRSTLHAQLVALGALPHTVVHPGASVSVHARLGHGVFVAAGAVVAPLALIKDGVIVNHGAVVDHDCVVGAFSHVAPNAALSGGVKIGSGVLVGAGANVLPGVSVGDRAVVGAGAVVSEDVPVGAVVIGLPARQRKEVVK
ncbi:MAG: NeuD/PglB/VioB family sugar acetyltransferase [Rhizobacter sp.]|nr:NeuD/PglB/VioB family sugar acetyltransferase [Rhizobacter sp.]